MIFVVNAVNRARFATDLLQMHRHRKAVFIDGLGWDIPVVDDVEMDRYDQDDTAYLIAKREAHGPVLASVRLLPTVQPHLMIDLFRDACRGHAPCGPAIWEVSRFCASPAVPTRRDRVRLFGEIVCGVLETALVCRVEYVTFSANAALLPLSMACGWEAKRLGATLPDGQDRLTAVRASVTHEGLCNVQRRFGIAGPVTQFPQAAARGHGVIADQVSAMLGLDPSLTTGRRSVTLASSQFSAA
jgi:N-acyl-L-homoserine lactone synthetase